MRIAVFLALAMAAGATAEGAEPRGTIRRNVPLVVQAADLPFVPDKEWRLKGSIEGEERELVFSEKFDVAGGRIRLFADVLEHRFGGRLDISLYDGEGNLVIEIDKTSRGKVHVRRAPLEHPEACFLDISSIATRWKIRVYEYIGDEPSPR